MNAEKTDRKLGDQGQFFLESKYMVCKKVCTDEQICNPKTKRCVDRKGKIGQQVLKNIEEEKKKMNGVQNQKTSDRNSGGKTYQPPTPGSKGIEKYPLWHSTAKVRAKQPEGLGILPEVQTQSNVNTNPPKIYDITRPSMMIAQGAFGKTYKYYDSPKNVFESFKEYFKEFLVGDLPDVRQELIIKVEKQNHTTGHLPSMKEAQIHKYLTNACSAGICAGQHVAKFFFAGQFRYFDTFQIICMSRAPGVPLSEFMVPTVARGKKDPSLAGQVYYRTFVKPFKQTFEKPEYVITPALIRNLEDAVRSMWLNGIAHADLHYNNILATKDGQVTIIDFGRAVTLPESILEKIKEHPNSMESMWYDTGLDTYVDGVMKYQRIATINPNGKILRHLHYEYTRGQ